MENKKKIIIFGTLGIISIIVAGLIFLRNSSQKTSQTDLASNVSGVTGVNGVVVREQFAGDFVLIDAVKLAERGFVAIHLQEDGEPGVLIGSSELVVTEATDIKIPLGRPVVEGEVIYVMLYTDVNDDGELLFDTDTPVLDEDGNVISHQIVVGPEQSLEGSADETESVFESIINESNVNISSRDYSFEPAQINVSGGTITVTVTENMGDHTFVIDELGVNEVLETGKTFSFEAAPGTYTFYCGVGNHKALGMEGTLVVE